MSAYVRRSARRRAPFDIVLEGETPGDDPAAAAAIVRPYAEAGATWWIEAHVDGAVDADGVEAAAPGTAEINIACCLRFERRSRSNRRQQS